jgi:cell wall-associated NlpC family hydrolase
VVRARKVVLALLAIALCQGAASIVSAADPVPAPPATTAGAEAQQAKDAADHKVAVVTKGVAGQAKHLAALTARASQAEENYLTQRTVQAQAQAAEAQAQTRLTVARAAYRLSYRAFAASAVASYESDGAPDSISSSSIAALLVVDDPNAVLNSGTQHEMLADHQANVLSRMTTDLNAVHAAESAQRAALADVTTQTARLAAIRLKADRALAAGRSALKTLKASLVKAKATQKQADATLSTFLGGWSAADPARAGALNQHYEAIALQVRTAKPAPSRGHWTAAIGQTVVNRVLQYLGTPYAWAGGSTAGPTAGVCAKGSARNDCHLTGFDCSGLALYGWAPYLSMAHNAAVQFGSGRLHPAPDALLPGDLVFWSSGHTAGGIHHVAIYVGDGNVIQAPQSGDIVRITPLGSVSSGYFGATRPLS